MNDSTGKEEKQMIMKNWIETEDVHIGTHLVKNKHHYTSTWIKNVIYQLNPNVFLFLFRHILYCFTALTCRWISSWSTNTHTAPMVYGAVIVHRNYYTLPHCDSIPHSMELKRVENTYIRWFVSCVTLVFSSILHIFSLFRAQRRWCVSIVIA